MPAIPDIAALYKGLLPNIVKEAPSSALYLGIYEVVRTEHAAYRPRRTPGASSGASYII